MSLQSFLQSSSRSDKDTPSAWEQEIMLKIWAFKPKKSDLLPGAEAGWVTAPEVGLNPPVRSVWWELETSRWSQVAVRLSKKGEEWILNIPCRNRWMSRGFCISLQIHVEPLSPSAPGNVFHGKFGIRFEICRKLYPLVNHVSNEIFQAPDAAARRPAKPDPLAATPQLPLSA